MTERVVATASNAWDPERYDGDHAFVHEYGADLLDLLDPRPGERVLDLGCGTGHLTAEIADRGAEVVSVDDSEAMIESAREAYPELSFARADATTFEAEESFDAAFSNAALHWIDDQAAVAPEVGSAAPDGLWIGLLGLASGESDRDFVTDLTERVERVRAGDGSVDFETDRDGEVARLYDAVAGLATEATGDVPGPATAASRRRS